MSSGEHPGRPGGRVFPGTPTPARGGNQVAGGPERVAGVPGQASGVPDQAPGIPDQASVTARLQDVDDALVHLADLPVDAQVAVFTDLHQRLTAALAVTATATGSADEQSARRPGPAHPSR